MPTRKCHDPILEPEIETDWYVSERQYIQWSTVHTASARTTINQMKRRQGHAMETGARFLVENRFL